MKTSGTVVAVVLLCALPLASLWGCGTNDARPAPESVKSAEAPVHDEPQRSIVDDLLAAEPVIPEGVVYKKATPEANRAAIEKLSQAFLAPGGAAANGDLCGQTLICGPGLWANLEDDAELKKIETGVTTFRVPAGDQMLVMKGKLLQTDDEVATFWQAFARRYERESSAIVRRPTAEELSLYWAMIPYDITEPVFVIEGRSYTLFVDLSGDDAKIQWVDDYKKMHF
jgi:hypothetical protein